MKSSDRWRFLKRSLNISTEMLIRGRYHFNFDFMPVHINRMSWLRRVDKLKSGGNLIYRRLYPWSWPNHLHIELTNYCNIKCKVCPTGIGTLNRKPAAMEPALLERLLDDVGPYLFTASLWGWGEPLLHPRLSDILRVTQNRNITTFLSTNGQNLDDDKVLQSLVDHPPTYLIVCLDGLTDETNSMFRVGAKIQPALDGVSRLAQMKKQKGLALPVLHFRYIAMKHNEHEVPRLEEFAAANHFDMMTIRTLSIIDAPDDTHHELVPDNETLRAYSYRDDKRIDRSDFICEKAFTFPMILADGTVVSCEQDYNGQYPYGTLTDGLSFAEIWWSKRAAEIRKIIRDNPETFSFCKNCPFKDRPISTCSIKYFNIAGKAASTLN
jgi:radical SAM protein with 4Fe4S-binding SPASM domain